MGRKGDATVTLVPGRQVRDGLDRTAGTGSRAILGVRAGAQPLCLERLEHAPAPAKGFHWPYLSRADS